MLRTFEIYTKDNFLGYEYAENDVEAIIKTRNKFGAPRSWGIDEYTVRKILWSPGIKRLTQSENCVTTIE